MQSWINQTLNSDLGVRYFFWALFHLYELLDLSNIPHISIILSDSLQIYRFNIYIYIYIWDTYNHTHIYIYIHIYRQKERKKKQERKNERKKEREGRS